MLSRLYNYIKYLLFRRLGDFPKTYSLIYLLRVLNQIVNDRLSRFINDNLEMIHFLEEAYMSSRYLPRTYDRTIAERVMKFSEEILEVLRWIESRI